MDDEDYDGKLWAAFEGKEWEGCYFLVDMFNDIPLILLSDDEHARIIRAEFKALYPQNGEQCLYDGMSTSGSCMWLVNMFRELSHHLADKKPNIRPLRWIEKRKSVKIAEHKAIKKNISNLIDLLKKTRMAEDQLTVAHVLGAKVEPDTTIISLLERLEGQIQQSAQEPSFLEKYIGKEIRRSKPGSLPVDVRVFISAIAKQLVKNLHLDHVPNKLIVSIASLKYKKFPGMESRTITEEEVESIIR